MDNTSQSKFRDTELDLDILATPFRVKTKWHVITGASSSGKTTIIDLLAEKGFHTFPEAGRQYFEQELAKGRTIDEIRADRAAMTREIYDLWLKNNEGLRTDEIAFLDRGLPDALSFYRFAGMNPNEILPDCFEHQYASVFILNRLPYQQDGIRGGDDVSAAYFDSWMERDYQALGYEIVRVPVLPPQERLTFILDKLSDFGFPKSSGVR
jgi:predicted ATPase